jgi:hypothetical protein
MTFELVQLRDQLAGSVSRLAEMLAESKLTVVDVEVAVDATWRAGALSGRLDLLLRDEAGRDVVLDLKWGGKRYRELLGSGLATQLAVYAAAYFSLSRGEVLATPGAPFARFMPIQGPPLADTWAKLERTVDRVERTLLAGRVPVTGLQKSLPLLETMGLDAQEQERHLALGNGGACQYCPYGAICGRDWERLT